MRRHITNVIYATVIAIPFAGFAFSNCLQQRGQKGGWGKVNGPSSVLHFFSSAQRVACHKILMAINKKRAAFNVHTDMLAGAAGERQKVDGQRRRVKQKKNINKI